MLHYLANNKDDVLSWIIFSKALQMSEAASASGGSTNKRWTTDAGFLDAVCQLWTAARMLEGDWAICDPEVIGLKPGKYGLAELTEAPMIDYGVSVHISERLSELRKPILATLDNWLQNGFRKHFVSLFLGLYIILHSFGLLCNQQRELARGLGKVGDSMVPKNRKYHRRLIFCRLISPSLVSSKNFAKVCLYS